MSDDNKSSGISVLLKMGKIVEKMGSENSLIDSEGMEKLNLKGGNKTYYRKRLQNSGLAEPISGKALIDAGLIKDRKQPGKQPSKKIFYHLTPRGRKFLDEYREIREKLDTFKNYGVEKANILDEDKLEKGKNIIESAKKGEEKIEVDENNRRWVIKKYYITIDTNSIISLIDGSIKYKKSSDFNNYEINTDNLRKHGSPASFIIDLKGFTDDEKQEFKSFLNDQYSPENEFQFQGSKIEFDLGNVVKGQLPECECCTEVNFKGTWVGKDESKIKMVMTIEKNLG